MSMKRLLVVDDDSSLRTLLKEALNESGYDTDVASDGTRALETLDSNRYDLILADLKMPGMGGSELLSKVKEDDPDVGFLIMTAYGTIEQAVRAIKNGAHDFVTKPFTLPEIVTKVGRYFEIASLQEENRTLKRKLSDEQRFKKLVGRSKAMQNVFHQINVVADSDATVFVQGESGTGKELIAQAICENSRRSDRPFLKVNCSAITETLFESTLFGHEKGAFTNAMKMHKGLFEEADGGSLLLDEISEMPLGMQPKFLRVLQEGTVTRVGSAKEIPVDVRIIATSNRDIRKRVAEERFRADLFFRINVAPITISPLRERPEDIPVLLEHFLNVFQEKYGCAKRKIGDDALKALIDYNWPGNVRQLENLVERAILFSGDEETLTKQHFSLDLEHLERNGDPEFNGTLRTLAQMEKMLIQATVKKMDNNRTQAAKSLGISTPTLRSKLQAYETEKNRRTVES